MLNIGSIVVNSLDYILIVDKNYTIVYNTRYDEKINDSSKEYLASDIINKPYFDVYPKLNKESSSVALCMETKQVIVKKSQNYTDYTGRQFLTNNVTVPLMRKGELVAVVELAMDVDVQNATANHNKELIFDNFVKKVKDEASLITFNTILTANKDMKTVIDKAKALALLPNPTLIYGETGTGKELFAQAMINYSQIPQSKVVIQNCAAIPESLIESILFGTVRGAYTGAENKIGLFDSADGGIIFLDELNSMPFHVQAKLLRVLQDGTYMPLGSSEPRKVNVKVIAAMNIEPMFAIENNIIRKDLFYRFSSGLINLIPLRDRKEDIELFISYYINYYSHAYDKSIACMDDELKELFLNYNWEGNVREVKNTIESMIASSPNEENVVLNYDMLPIYLKKSMSFNDKSDLNSIPIESHLDENGNIPFKDIVGQLEKELIIEALKISGNNKSKASEILGLPRQTLKYKLEKLGM